MIEIRITDPENSDRTAVAAIARALLEIAGENPRVAHITLSGLGAGGGGSGISDRRATPRPAAAQIDPEDLPDVGAETITPAQAFARAEDDGPVVEPDPAEVFANPAEVFAQAGNAPGATSPTPSGTPPVPNNGAETAGAATPANGVAVDTRGLPWDVRIHASTKTTNKDGSWKKKPNTDPALIAQVEAELRAVMAIPAPAGNVPPTGASVSVPPPPTTAATIPQPPTTAASAPATIPTAPAGATSGNAIPTPPASPPTTHAAAASSITSFAQLLPAVTNAVAAGTLTQERVAQVLAPYGMAVLPQLAPRPDLVAAVAAELFPAAQQ